MPDFFFSDQGGNEEEFIEATHQNVWVWHPCETDGPGGGGRLLQVDHDHIVERGE